MLIKAIGSRPDTLSITFHLPATFRAHVVHLVGDFNGWNRHSHPMRWSVDENAWQITLELVRGQPYQFRYLVNGTDWRNDWKADRYLPNPFGGENSVLET